MAKIQKLKFTKTGRGFKHASFKDYNGLECSIQKSSSLNEPLIWLGVDKEVVSAFCLNNTNGWTTFKESDLLEKFNAANISLSGRMHLSQDDVKKLLPTLIKFAETGEI